MLSWYIHKPDWLLLADDDIHPPTGASVSGAAAVVRQIFVEWFGENHVSALHPVTVLRGSQDYPQCFKVVGTVFLTSSAFDDPRVTVFQFAHELCHLMIAGAVPQKFKWFEETVCRCASIEALRSIVRNSHGFHPSQIPHFQWYISSLIADSATIPGGVSISSYVSDNLAFLDENPTARRINNIIAESLTPVLAPSFWQCVPHLCDIPENCSFEDGMRQLASYLPEDESGQFLDLLIGC